MEYKIEHAKTIFETVTPYKVVSIKRFNAPNFKDNKFEMFVDNENPNEIEKMFFDYLEEFFFEQFKKWGII